MKLIATIFAIALAAVSTGSFAQDTPTATPARVRPIPAQYTSQFFFSPSIRYVAGKTAYIMDIRQFDPTYGALRLKSQLEFPLDGVLAGGTFGLHLTRYDRPLWRFELGVWTNANQPGGTMYDHDWANFYTGTYEKFSYTESDVEMKSFLLDFRGAYEFYSRPSWGLSLTAGFRYQHISQHVIGFAGWQLDQETLEPIRFDFDSVLGITYTVDFHVPNLGFMLSADLGRGTSVSVTGAGAALIVSDEDNHLLRGKIATADILGWGLLTGASLDITPGAAPRGLFFSLSGDLSYYNASGKQTQTWYVDEYGYNPDTGEDEVIAPAGTTLPNIPHDIKSLQFHTGLEVGLRF